MALNINPLAIAVGAIAIQAAAQASEDNASPPPGQVSESSKASLDDTVSRLSDDISAASKGLNETLGELDSNINEFASNAYNNLTEAVSTVRDAAEIAGTLEKLTGGSLAGGLSDLASGISKSAGILNDILSLKRGANLPAGADLFQSTGQSIKVQPSAKNDWRVKINTNWAIFNSALFKRLEETGGVVFPFTPQINFSTSANYNEIEPTHSNYPFNAYQNSKIEDIQITAEFVNQTAKDAEYFIAAMTFFKTATKMFYGQGANAGNPPIICHLSGYGSQMFDRVPVVITSFSLDLPNDVDYIQYSSGNETTWVPTAVGTNISARPIYNRAELRKFNLQQYAQGNMVSPSGGKYL